MDTALHDRDPNDRDPNDRDPNDPITAWRCTWHSGPDAGGSSPLPVGRHVLGRAHTAPVRCDDPRLQPYHALVEILADGRATITQLTGRLPVVVDGRAADGLTALTDGSVVEVGGSTAVFVRSAAAAAPAAAAQLHGGALVRGVRAVPQWEPTRPAMPGKPPERQGSAAGLVPAALGLVGAGLIALVTGQTMFLLFGALGGLVAVGSWGAQHVAAARRHHRELAAHRRQVRSYEAALHRDQESFRAAHLTRVPTVATAQQMILERTTELWTRRPDHPDAWLVAVGRGAVALPTDDALAADEDPGALRAPSTAELPVAASLGPGSRTAVRGPGASASVRAMIVQLVASCGPADVRIVIVTDRPRAWECVRALPHLALPDAGAAIVAEAGLAEVLADLAGSPHLLFVTDCAALLATRTSPLRRAVADPARHALLVALDADTGVPHLCTSVLTLGNGPIGRWVADTRVTLLPEPVRVAGAGERATFACADALRALVDPEDAVALATAIPRELTLLTLLAGDREPSTNGTPLVPSPAMIAATWRAAGDDPHPRTLIGLAADGAVDIDLVRDGPHGLIAGTTGAGKSELLRSLVAGMAAGVEPAHLSFLLIDYKGGATFDACAALPHVVGVVTDLDAQLADRALRSLHAELRRREALLREHGAADLAGLRATAPQVVLPRLVVVIDEFATLVAEQPAFLHALVGVAQRGRSLGVHLLLATQRPGGVLSDDIRANTNLRLALRLQDTADAIDVVGIPSPSLLPRGLPGRAVIRLGADDHLTFQAASCTATTAVDSGDSELHLLVGAIGEAARLLKAPAPTAPWLPPLPAILPCTEVPAGALGVVDDPDHQRRLGLRWAPADGHLLVAGSTGAGATSTLCTVAAHVLCAGQTSGEGCDLYVLDGRGDAAFDALTEHPRCVAVIRVHERERVMRLLHRLRDRTRHGVRPVGDGACGVRQVVLLVDGLDAVRRSLDGRDTDDELAALDEVLTNGDAGGITIVAGVEHTAAVPAAVLARCAQRWVLHLHDAHDASLLGVAAANVPPAGVAGRLVVAHTGLVAQVVQPGTVDLLGARTTWHAAHEPAPPITIMPTLVDAAELPPGRCRDGVHELPLGRCFANDELCVLQLHEGEHVLVLGGARSGRSAALERIARGWLAGRPQGWVGVVAPRRGAPSTPWAHAGACDATLLADMPDDRDVLLVVDDAELVDDPGGRLAAAMARPGVCVLAAGRPEALRQQYGHWTTVVRRSRLGLVLTSGSELDGDLLGIALPRRTPVPPRPGLAWVVANGAAQLVQLALDRPRRAAAGPLA